MASLEDDLAPLFRPRSVAIIGASATPFKHGNLAVKNLLQGGFDGPIYPINPSAETVEGLRCHASIENVPGPVDCVFTLVPAAATVETIRACARKGVRAVIVGASGFAEIDTPEGHAREREITAIARAAGMRLMGPNTNGIWNATDRVSIGFNTSHGGPMTPGPLSIAAHSGALFDSLAPSLQRFGVGLSKFAPVGNEADLDLCDFLEYFIADEATRVIGLIVESLRDGARFHRLALAARAANKPIVALKLGRSAAGAQAALAHSSRLAGSARAYEALFAECGVPMVTSIESLAGAAAVLASTQPQRLGGDQALVCITTSGGGGALLADHAADRDIALAGGDDGLWKGRVAEAIAAFGDTGLVRNPIDGGALGGWQRLEPVFAAMEAENLRGPVALFAHRLPQESRDLHLADMLLARRARTGAPLVVAAPGGLRPAVAERFRAGGGVVFDDIGACFDSLAAFYDLMSFYASEPEAPEAATDLAAEAAEAADAALGPLAPGAFLSEFDSARVLAAAGVPMIESEIATGAAAAAMIGEEIGYPVVMKALVEGVAHKNDAGLVIVGVEDAAGARAAHQELTRRAARAAPGKPATILVQPMAAARAELILGATHEP
ncbi:MAG TPA: CoA-binding protein, partial [Beijerinckiaceae bacterium]